MRNTVLICLVLNVCSLSLIAALYMFYQSIISTQADIRRDIATIEDLIRQEIVFDIVEPEKPDGVDIENCCDFMLTPGKSIYMEPIK